MGWRELRHWLREMHRAKKAEAGRDRTDPDSWEGQENDHWWAEMRERNRRLQGH